MSSVSAIPVEVLGSTDNPVRMLARFVKQCMSQQERILLMLRYGEKLTWTEVAMVLGLSAEEVRKIHDTVVGRVQAEFMPAAD